MTERLVPVTHTKAKKGGTYQISKTGLYYNGRGFVGKTGASFEIFLTNVSEITVLGDVSFTGGKAKVYINDKYFQTIDAPYIANFQSKFNGFLKNRPATTYYQTPLAIISLPEGNAGDTKIKD